MDMMLRVHSHDLHDHLVQEVGQCLESGLYTDLIIRCKGGQNIHAHKLVLSSVSPFLKWIFENNDWEEVQSLELPDAKPSLVMLLLEVVYNGVVEATMNNLRQLILLASQLFISIPISEDLMRSLDLRLPSVPGLVPRSLPKLKQRPDFASSSNNNMLYNHPVLPPPPPPLSPTYHERNFIEAATAAGILSTRHKQDHVCPICNSRYSNIGNFKQHMRLHDNEQLTDHRNQILSEIVASGFNPLTALYSCHVCNSTYNHSGNFKQHLLKHERESGSISALLVAQVNTNTHLTDVLQSAMADRVHHGDEEADKMPYQCEHCGRGFKHPGNYKQHLASHLKAVSSNSAFGALVSNSLKKINATFGISSSHKSRSSPEKIPKFEQDFPSSNASVNPKKKPKREEGQQIEVKKEFESAKSSSPEAKQFQCKECQESFETEAWLNRHVMTFHVESEDPLAMSVSASTEETGFVDWASAFKKKPGHPPTLTTVATKSGAGTLEDPTLVVFSSDFKCRICMKQFHKMSKLRAHMRIHSAPEDHYRFPCDICGKKFTRPQHVNRHKLLHTGERPFKCWFCEKAYAREDKCKHHMKTECEFRSQFNSSLSNPDEEMQDEDLSYPSLVLPMPHLMI